MITVEKMKALQTQCGTYATAKHLNSLGYSLEEALFYLARK